MKNIDWFRNAGLGIFVHWGVYSAIGRGEWVMNQEQMSLEEYDSYIPEFTAESIDFDEWARLAKDAGAEYMVLTTKHHDGFCLFRTTTTHRNSVEQGPKRDLVAKYVEACRRNGLKVGLYFSLPDWSVPAFNEGPEAENWNEFVEMAHTQVRELMSNYGKIDLLWYDRAGNMANRQVLTAENLRGVELNAMVRKLQPGILINDRSELAEDFYTAEQNLAPPKEPGRAWEGCLTMNRHWGWFPADQCYKTPFEIIMAMTGTACSGGHILLNIGPDKTGCIKPAEKHILHEIGKWMHSHAMSIKGTERIALSGSTYGCASQKNGVVYLYVHWSYKEGRLVIPNCKEKFARATLLAENVPLKIDYTENKLIISGIPVSVGTVQVIKLERS